MLSCLTDLPKLVLSLPWDPERHFRASSEQKLNIEAGQHAEVSIKAPYLKLSHGSPFGALPLGSATLYFHYVQGPIPQETKLRTLPEELCSWPRPTWPSRPPLAHLLGPYFPILVMLCCGYLHFSSSAQPHCLTPDGLTFAHLRTVMLF